MVVHCSNNHSGVAVWAHHSGAAVPPVQFLLATNDRLIIVWFVSPVTD